MSQLESLLNAIPYDPNVAFILADCLEEQGDPRCELLRLSYTLKDIIEITLERVVLFTAVSSGRCLPRALVSDRLFQAEP